MIATALAFAAGALGVAGIALLAPPRPLMRTAVRAVVARRRARRPGVVATSMRLLARVGRRLTPLTGLRRWQLVVGSLVKSFG